VRAVMDMVLVMLASACVVLIGAVGMAIGWEWLTQPSERPGYAFVLPQQDLSCWKYEMKPGESFGNWEIHQPITFYLQPGSQLHHLLFDMGVFPPWGCNVAEEATKQ
jgi:hypothetical protein